MNERCFTTCISILILVLITVVPRNFAHAQQVDLRLEPSSALENAQVLSLTGLGIDTEGSGSVLISAFMENLSDELLENLYLEVTINASKVGNIAELTSNFERPFSLDPRQSVYATNNDLANESIPGIEEIVSFSGGLTSQGEDFLNNLDGTTLPRDTYSLEVVIFQRTNAQGRVNLARDFVEIGGGSSGIASFDESEIYLKTPGDIVGEGAEITNPYPQFNWEGATNVEYRLIVVEQGQGTPESLIQTAKSSAPLSEGGSLLQFENLDVFVDGNSYQFPSSGAQSLEAGKLYYWRVFTTIQGSGDSQEISSEIWSFKLQSTSEATTSAPFSSELERSLIELLGNDQYQRLENSGFTLEGIEYDGQEFTGQAAALKLEELLEKIRNEEIILTDN